ncbi:interleukin-12 subunit alpha [Larimichthys crocea]|uniref:interleukin-12 subunit alpha n=1 Tax=Larimichthys crocea TaxID=215358 RepID=UPI000900CC52|nr:interleukin-12 subunit alpha [Larimichthys crocea]
MAIFNFYFTSCVLLLLTLNWRTSIGHPVRTLSPEMCANCSSLYKSLLTSIAQLRSNKELCYGIPSDRVVVGSQADTVLACAPSLPQNSGCMMQKNPPFSESECLKNIMKDLAYYAAAFESYLETPLQNPVNTTAVLKPVQDTIQSLRKNCSLKPNGENDSSEVNTAKIWGNESFNNRLEMCDMLRGFYVRAITINRAMGYISSGDYKK